MSAMIKPLGEYVHCASVWCQDLALPCIHATHSVLNGRGNASVEVREVRKLREEKVKAMMEGGNSEREIMRERLTLRKEMKTNVLWEKEVKTYPSTALENKTSVSHVRRTKSGCSEFSQR